MACHCRDYTRSQLLREGAARAVEAGGDLPAIEAGMPDPAGTGMTRRSFVSRSAGMALAVYGAAKLLSLEALEEGIAGAAGARDPILVSLFFDGGVDNMSLLAPVGHARYAQLRPNLALSPAEGIPFAEDTSLHWHPAAADLATLYGEGKVSVFPAIGYSSADQSHFTSRHYWEIGEVSVGANTGWLGRYLDRHGSDTNPLQGLSLDWRLSPALATAKRPVAAVESVDDYGFWTPGVGEPVEEPMFRAFRNFGARRSSIPAVSQARTASEQTTRLRKQLAPFDGYSSPVAYPKDNYLARRLAGLAALIDAGLPLSCVTVDANGGYDTHSDQEADFNRGVSSTAAAILAFQRDLEARGIDDRVLIEVWSEFGRRPEDNGGGTDHGAAGCGFIIGSRARGQMVREFPGLTQLDGDDNLRHTSDFRAMYASLLEQWLGVDAAPIIPGASSLARYQLLKG